MQDIASIFQIVLVIAAVVSPAVLFVRIARGDGSLSLASLFYTAPEHAWPRGVQEEEPVHFVFEAAGV